MSKRRAGHSEARPVPSNCAKHKENRPLCSLIFFFQAEDGIRGTSVTGVQTCALPISARATAATVLLRFPDDALRKMLDAESLPAYRIVHRLAQSLANRLRELDAHIAEMSRSEERRVGKEGRARRWPDQATNRHEADRR